MAGQIGGTGADSLGVRLGQVGLCHAAVGFQRPDGGDQHHGAGVEARVAALDVQELLSAQVRAKARLGDHIVRQFQAQLGGGDAVAAVGDVGEGAAVDDGGVVFQRLHQIGVDGVLQQGGHGARRADLARRHRLAVVGVGADDAGQPLFQVFQVGGKAEDGHDLAGDGDIKAVLPGRAVHLAAQTVHNEPQLTVVHVHAALPGDAAGVDVQRVALLDGVVDHGRQQIVGGADGVQVAGKMQVDVLHGHHLRVAAAGRAALDAEHGAERRLPQAEHGLFAQRVHGVRQTHAGGGFALAGGGGADGGDEDQLAVGTVAVDELVVDLGLVAAVGDEVLFVQTQPGGNLGDGLHLGGLCDFNIGKHRQHSFATTKGQHTRQHCHAAAQTVGLHAGIHAVSPVVSSTNPSVNGPARLV